MESAKERRGDPAGRPKENRHKLLGSLFIEAGKRGIAQEYLRNDIAPEYLGKRLSEASEVEIKKLRSHITGYKNGYRGYGLRGKKKYESSLAGLKEEVCDLAKARWGEGREGSLNAFCKRFGVAKWQWLNVNHAVAIKKRLIAMQGKHTPNPSEEGNKKRREI